MLDKSGIYPGFIWDISGIYPGFIYIPDKSRIYLKCIPEYIQNISGIYSQIYLGFQGWGVGAPHRSFKSFKVGKMSLKRGNVRLNFATTTKIEVVLASDGLE
jgi:hypothetical protein